MSKLNAQEIGIFNREQIKDYFASNPDWISAVALSGLIDLHVNVIHAHCRYLVKVGYLEFGLIRLAIPNNSARQIIHYRLASIKSSHCC
ncbi:MAG: hypothetical protein KME09_14780 [Pleurocapsa minor HA4230-MV1]|nr:hypothetical protein [Pleurocapsa minor HA4230-MV1]